MFAGGWTELENPCGTQRRLTRVNCRGLGCAAHPSQAWTQAFAEANAKAPGNAVSRQLRRSNGNLALEDLPESNYSHLGLLGHRLNR
jgi:hypothetical protein